MSTEVQAPARVTVDSREGTVTGPGGTIRLEPKVMEVLAFLAGRAGQVVPRDELLDAVWPDVVVTEHTLSRCIYQLRNKLGKVAANPADASYDPIETLPKRGYRLLVTVTASHSDIADTFDRSAMPFVVGQWVRGERFYGREAQIEEIFEGHRNCIWLLGTRRIGKTSLLKQVEHIAETTPDNPYFPIFWDFQGAETPEELHLNFGDALLDAEERLERIGIAVKDVEADDLFVSLEQLRRRLRSKKLKLLLLCDEVEELIKLHQQAPSLLRKLRHVMQSREDIRTVLASTIRLWALSGHKEDTSPFLHGFAPPLYIERLSDEEARSLIEQSHLGPGQRPTFEDGVVEAIREHCDNHPYLVQLVCKRYLEAGSLEEAIEQVATDRMVSYFFSVDFEMLSASEGDIIRMIAQRTAATKDSIEHASLLGSDALDGALRRLENLGFVRRDDEYRFELANYFFRRWLQAVQVQSPPAVAEPEPVVNTKKDVAERVGLFEEFKRRNVVRVAVAYIVTAWVLLQVGEITFAFLEVPLWAGKLLIVFLALGFPIAAVLAWVFELTPEGVKLEKDIDRSKPATQQAGRKLNYVIIAVLTIAVLFFVFDKFA